MIFLKTVSLYILYILNVLDRISKYWSYTDPGGGVDLNIQWMHVTSLFSLKANGAKFCNTNYFTNM